MVGGGEIGRESRHAGRFAFDRGDPLSARGDLRVAAGERLVPLDDDPLAERAQLLEVAHVRVRLGELAVALDDQPLPLGDQWLDPRVERLQVAHVRVRLGELAVALDDQRLAFARERVEPQRLGRLPRRALPLGFAGVGEEREGRRGRGQRRGHSRRDDDEVHRLGRRRR